MSNRKLVTIEKPEDSDVYFIFDYVTKEMCGGVFTDLESCKLFVHEQGYCLHVQAV